MKFIPKSRRIDYKEYEKYNEGRKIEEKDWSSGEEMADIVRQRYKKIVKARYGTWDGLCFMAAGIALFGGSLPIVTTPDMPIQNTITVLCVIWCIFLCFMGVVFFIRRERNLEKKYIDEGKFLWKMDEVYSVLPDRYPKANKILVKTEEKPVFTLQAFFWFKPDDYVYVIKRNENAQMEAFMY